MEIDQGTVSWSIFDFNVIIFQGAELNQQHLPFVEKYRPDDLSQIISHTQIVSTSKFPFFLAKLN